MKVQANQKRRDVSNKVRDHVYVWLQQGKYFTVARRENYKLAPKYFGSYEVIECIGLVAYRLRMPKASQIHPVFHVSQLKRTRALPGPSQVKQLKWYPGYQTAYEPEALRGVREENGRREVLIKRTHMPKENATWEAMDYIGEYLRLRP
ncbi:unnamed protein product [Rhodiola kirilowii]